MDNTQPFDSNLPSSNPATPADNSDGQLYGINNHPSEMPTSINTGANPTPAGAEADSSNGSADLDSERKVLQPLPAQPINSNPLTSTAENSSFVADPTVSATPPSTNDTTGTLQAAPQTAVVTADPVSLSSTVSVIPAALAEQPISAPQPNVVPNAAPAEPQPVTPPSPAPASIEPSSVATPQPFNPPAPVGGGLPGPAPGEVSPNPSPVTSEPPTPKSPAKHAKTLVMVIVGVVLLVATIGIVLIMAGVFA